MVNGFVYVTRHQSKLIKLNPCKLRLHSPLYPKWFKHYHNVAIWCNCYHIHDTFLSSLSAEDNIRDKFYNVSLDTLKEMITEYENFLCESEWEDYRMIEWKDAKKMAYRNLRQMIKVMFYMTVFPNEGRLCYFYQMK